MINATTRRLADNFETAIMNCGCDTDALALINFVDLMGCNVLQVKQALSYAICNSARAHIENVYDTTDGNETVDRYVRWMSEQLIYVQSMIELPTVNDNEPDSDLAFAIDVVESLLGNGTIDTDLDTTIRRVSPTQAILNDNVMIETDSRGIRLLDALCTLVATTDGRRQTFAEQYAQGLEVGQASISNGKFSAQFTARVNGDLTFFNLDAINDSDQSF